jgi:hypothetical protein
LWDQSRWEPVDLPSVLRDSHRVQQRICTALVVGMVCGACLPAGTSPIGRHVLHDRGLTAAYLLPAGHGEAAFILAAGPARSVVATDESSTETFSDLYALPVASGTVGASAAASHLIAPGFLYASWPEGRAVTDSQGRLLLAQYDEARWAQGLMAIRRIDPKTWQPTEIGTATMGRGRPPLVASTAGTRVLMVGAQQDGVLAELDSARSLGPIAPDQVAFIGEDLYYVSATSTGAALGSSVLRLRAQARVPETVLASTGPMGFIPIAGDRTAQLLLTLPTNVGASPFALLDTSTLASTTLPPQKGQAPFVAASSDGHWLLFSLELPAAGPSQPAGHRLFAFDWTSGAYTVLDAARVGQGIGELAEWRPGTSELWFSTLPSGLAIWRPGVDLVKVDRVLLRDRREPDGQGSLFTRDGRYWFSATVGDQPTRPTACLGRADDPSAACLPINPQGTAATSHWELGDGRLVVEAWPIDASRSDMFLVDGAAGSVQVLANGGHVVAVGEQRALALVDWQLSGATGTLVLIDTATSSRTVLAEDVYAVDPGVAATATRAALSPGSRIAYLTRNRLESPYDGLWVAELP